MCHSNAPRPIPGSRLNATWHRGEWFVSNVSPDIFTPASPLSDEKVGSNKEGRWWETRGYSNGSHMTQHPRAFAPPLNSSNECVSRAIFGWSHPAHNNVYTRWSQGARWRVGSREKPQHKPEDTDPIRDKIESRARPRVSWRSNKSSRGRLGFSNWSGSVLRNTCYMCHTVFWWIIRG